MLNNLYVNTVKFTLLLILLLLINSSIFNVYYMYKQLYMYMLAGLTAYWFFSIFMFLNNVSLFKGVATSITRFWRRGIMLFWSIEMFVCGCYIFLILNCAVETEWLAYQNQLLSEPNLYFNQIIRSFSMLILLIFFVVSVMRFGVNINSSINSLILFFIYLFTIFLFLDESYQFFYQTSMYFIYSYQYDIDEMVWDYTLNNGPSLVIKQYYFLLVFLKFWHAFLVYSGVIFTLRSLSLKNYQFKLPFFKLTLVNLNFLIVFSLAPLLFHIKIYIKALSSFVYFWFGINVINLTILTDILYFIF